MDFVITVKSNFIHKTRLLWIVQQIIFKSCLEHSIRHTDYTIKGLSRKLALRGQDILWSYEPSSSSVPTKHSFLISNHTCSAQNIWNEKLMKMPMHLAGKKNHLLGKATRYGGQNSKWPLNDSKERRKSVNFCHSLLVLWSVPDQIWNPSKPIVLHSICIPFKASFPIYSQNCHVYGACDITKLHACIHTSLAYFSKMRHRLTPFNNISFIYTTL